MSSGLKAGLIELESQLSSLFRYSAYAAARDITDQAAAGALLVVAPHPDDETLGCGAAIMRARDRGHAVRIVVVTDGQASHVSATLNREALVALRQSEAITACERLGVDREEVVFLNYPDGQAQIHFDEATRRLGDLIQAFNPSVVLYPSAIDSHPDHRASAAVVEQLARQGSITCPVYAYPVWFWRLRTWFNIAPMLRLLGRAKLVRISTQGFVERKRFALAAHRSQFENLTGEEGWEVLKPNFTKHFMGPYELFFDMRVERTRSASS